MTNYAELNRNTVGQVWQDAPNQSTPPGTIHGVWVYPHEEVEWTWTHTPGGSYISEYAIKPRMPEAKENQEA